MGPHQCQWDRRAPLPAKFERAFALLFEAATYAEHTSGERWEFAVGIIQLQSLGLSDNDLRYLVRLSYVDHSREVTVAGDNGRQFQPTGDLFFAERTCFVLTARGISAALGSFNNGGSTFPARASTIRIANDLDDDRAPNMPAWDAERRILSFAGQVVKQFKWHAVNQETILSAFQEEGWPVRIDDPLPPVDSLDVKRRLNETIKSLNRSQSQSLIRFRGDGTGQGVIWEQIPALSTNSVLYEI
jgi:hypothetical protein